MPHRVQIPFPRLHGPLCMVCATMPEAERRMPQLVRHARGLVGTEPCRLRNFAAARAQALVSGMATFKRGNYICAAKEGYPCQQSKMTKNDRAFTA
jgi:hypothetical protein